MPRRNEETTAERESVCSCGGNVGERSSAREGKMDMRGDAGNRTGEDPGKLMMGEDVRNSASEEAGAKASEPSFSYIVTQIRSRPIILFIVVAQRRTLPIETFIPLTLSALNFRRGENWQRAL